MPSRAHGGTLYLEDVAELEIGLQTKLLRWLETGMVESEGGAAQVPSDARIVCGGPRDPRSDVQAGRLREDLFFRLNVISIALPPVREREDDAVLLARHALRRFAAEESKQFRDIDPAAEYALRTYSWPGNVREIENVMRSVVVLHEGEIVRADMLPLHLAESALQSEPPKAADTPQAAPLPAGAKPAIRPLWITERETIEAAIAACDGNIPRAAAFLEISPSTIYRKKQAWEAIDRGA